MKEQQQQEEEKEVRQTPSTRIVGGEKVKDEDEFPFFVNLGGCGGALIHPDM
jgi:hypothetical protein